MSLSHRTVDYCQIAVIDIFMGIILIVHMISDTFMAAIISQKMLSDEEEVEMTNLLIKYVKLGSKRGMSSEEKKSLHKLRMRLHRKEAGNDLDYREHNNKLARIRYFTSYI